MDELEIMKSEVMTIDVKFYEELDKDTRGEVMSSIRTALEDIMVEYLCRIKSVKYKREELVNKEVIVNDLELRHEYFK